MVCYMYVCPLYGPFSMLHSQKHYISIETSLAQTLGSSYTKGKKGTQKASKWQSSQLFECSSIATVVFQPVNDSNLQALVFPIHKL